MPLLRLERGLYFMKRKTLKLYLGEAAMKKYLKGLIKRTIQEIITTSGELSSSKSGEAIDKKLQILLSLKYKEIALKESSLPGFSDVEFSNFSQNEEDGILLYIFSLIGTTNKRVVEICAGDGIECNAANLIINHGWEGLLFDGNQKLIEQGKSFYLKNRTGNWRLRRLPPKLIHAWITRENVNKLITTNDFAGEIDLLSLDMDGVDFWIWKEISCINPRVVILEYNNRWSDEQSVTVPYSENFTAEGATVSGIGYFGASLSAFNKLAKEKGYRLVGANSPNTNALFIRNEIGQEYFPEVSVESCLSSSYAIHQHKTKYPLIKDKPVEVI